MQQNVPKSLASNVKRSGMAVMMRKFQQKTEQKNTVILAPEEQAKASKKEMEELNVEGSSKCLECGSSSVITNSVQGTITCQSCGLVQSSRIIDESAEWRSFGAGEGGDDGKADMNRVGGALNHYLSNSGLDTNIMGNNSSQYIKWQIKGQQQSMTSKDRSMVTCMKYMKDLCDRLSIKEDTLKRGYDICKTIEDAGLGRGQRINVKCATIIYMACLNTKNPKDIKDICKATNTIGKQIQQCYKKIKPALPGATIGMTASKYTEKACKKLNIDSDTTEICSITADNITNTGILTGRKPSTIACVAIYMIMKKSPQLLRANPLHVICQTLEMGETAVKNAYKEVEEIESDILPMKYIQKLV